MWDGRDKRRIDTAEMKTSRPFAGYIRLPKLNTEIFGNISLPRELK
jgi:hypothetical protein